ncbi:glycyl-radical enzyme activating protein [Eubacterium sp. am_0171]|uniref:4-hydroxyphenylacetate decarboxylase activating enzyme n=1 Tax=Faecalicatena contorta TaxID=39482 RepID=A0A174DVP3_9FIRM|nr:MULTISPECIES: 4-hydroxyphenylacetate decarboxylase activase [Clostridia]MSC86483.1 4-hydroxyphenylacetate decarboxylase activase [Eubacterium sp. BIOML-A1]MSD08726.1 4-hydroxyphenylacetate decarboxylase activase [Eubacterium sp. BIOML-A2]RYT11378.1 glycyl-radical enzyme activating protein [Eubacterium sp. am_0171]CUO29504.1 4-hydroxyphenylacetate decarboxylase activating enzyme [[Eubacterium] contortum] [Faecalicatena contorta]
MEKNGLIFDIQSYSVHDGPGCRTNVFFIGCPLECRWCANPESWKRKKHIMFAEKVCKYDKGCRACRNTCPKDSIKFDENGKPSITWSICEDCESFECISICPNNALKQCVKEYTVDGLMKILKRDFSNWGSEGGVTFSGGDPLMHHDFLYDVLMECKKSQIHTAIETSGFATEENFLKILTNINFAFIDVKNMDAEAHKWGTGVGNELILSNIEALVKSPWNGRLVLRQPTIHDYNDSDENAMKLIEFMKRLDLFEINLLKFHRMGTSKWEQLGKQYEYVDHGDMTDERMKELQSLYLDNGIACYIGDDTPF